MKSSQDVAVFVLSFTVNLVSHLMLLLAARPLGIGSYDVS